MLHFRRFALKRFKEFNFTSIPREGTSVMELEREIVSQCFLESHGLPNFIHRIPGHLKKQHLSIGFFGHKGAGKCTVASHILLRGISGRIPVKNEERRAETFMMDTSETERSMALFQALHVEWILPKEKNTVLKLPRAQFDVGRRRFVISDSPALAADVDIGVLVISAVEGEFDDAYKKGLQISETLQIAGANGGATKMIVVVNKMDIVNWSKDRYDEIKVKMTAFLKASGYNVDKDVQFLPVAAVDGSNMRTRVDESVCFWWTEGCLDEVLGGIEVAFPKALPRGNADEYAALNVADPLPLMLDESLLAHDN